MTKRVPSVLATIALGLMLSAASAQAQDEYGVVLKTLANPYWGAMSLGVEAGAKSAGVSYYAQAVENDQATESQLNLCMAMLERKPIGLLVAAINATNLLPCIKAAQAANIQVADLDVTIDPNVLKKEGIELAFRIGSDNISAGHKAADYLASKLGKDARGHVLVLEGIAGSLGGKQRAVGFAEKLKELAPNLQIVASLPGDWDRGKAASITNDVLTRNPDLAAIFAANDSMALGAVESAYAAGRGGQITIIGVDGTTDAVKSIKEGRLNASVAQLPFLVGKQAVESLKKVIAGEKSEQYVPVPTLVLDKQMLDAGTDPMLEFVK
jgi:D-allose transport system substrate-binding protein